MTTSIVPVLSVSDIITIQSESFEYFNGLNKLEGFGHVYLIRCGSYHKIGISSNVVNRIQAIQNAIPYDIKVVDTFVSLDIRADEIRLHSLFSEYSHRNEWFKLPLSMVSARSGWFFSTVTPSSVVERIRRECFQFTSEARIQSMCGVDIDLDDQYLIHKKEQFRLASIANILLKTSYLADRFNIEVDKLHDDLNVGLYGKTTKQLRIDGGVEKETPLNYLSELDISYADAASGMVIKADNPALMALAASGIADLHHRITGQKLEPTWDNERLTPAKARKITHSSTYQMEMGV